MGGTRVRPLLVFIVSGGCCAISALALTARRGTARRCGSMKQMLCRSPWCVGCAENERMPESYIAHSSPDRCKQSRNKCLRTYLVVRATPRCLCASSVGGCVERCRRRRTSQLLCRRCRRGRWQIAEALRLSAPRARRRRALLSPRRSHAWRGAGTWSIASPTRSPRQAARCIFTASTEMLA